MKLSYCYYKKKFYLSATSDRHDLVLTLQRASKMKGSLPNLSPSTSKTFGLSAWISGTVVLLYQLHISQLQYEEEQELMLVFT